MNSYTLQFIYVVFIIVGIAYYVFESYKIKIQLLRFIDFYNSYLKTVINIKIEGDYFNGKERLWHGKDSIEKINEDDLLFLFTRSVVTVLIDKEKAKIISYFYFSDEFKILGELGTKISPEVNGFIADKNLEKLLKKYWRDN